MRPPTIRTRVANVLVVGAGAAGLRAAIAAHEAGAEVVILGKRLRLDAHTVLAAGEMLRIDDARGMELDIAGLDPLSRLAFVRVDPVEAM